MDLKQLMNAQRVPDENAIRLKLDEISNYKNELNHLTYAQQIEFRKLISDDQWLKIHR